jgi:hypothetical protein
MHPRERLAFSPILAHDGVVAWDGAKLLDWYLAARH